jgi:succinyl-CoA synthetase beta subunit
MDHNLWKRDIAMNLFKDVLEKGDSALNEYESKQVLASYGIPIVREKISSNPSTAAEESLKIGLPVVLKACGRNLSHKTEVGGVALNLKNVEEVEEESHRLLKVPGCEALLVQEMVRGERELICGLFRDAMFGPCVMFGLGGIFTELLEDVAFRVAPLTSHDAREMLDEIRARKVLQPFRGESAVDLDKLTLILTALGEIGLRYEEVHEIDINPLKIRPDGNPVVVDALIVLERAQKIHA